MDRSKRPLPAGTTKIDLVGENLAKRTIQPSSERTTSAGSAQAVIGNDKLDVPLYECKHFIVIERCPGVSLELGEERDFSRMISQMRRLAQCLAERDTERNGATSSMSTR
jgi:hypothetical protein